MRINGKASPVPTKQAPATLDQAAPVQNTWYTILSTTVNCRLETLGVYVATTGETLEVRATIDGQTIASSGFAAAANTIYFIGRGIDVNGGLEKLAEATSANTIFYGAAFLFEAKSIKVEVRKTTAAGAGNLKGIACYSKW